MIPGVSDVPAFRPAFFRKEGAPDELRKHIEAQNDSWGM